MDYPNIYSLFRDRVQKYCAAKPAQNVFFVRRDEEWQPISWDRFNSEAHDFAAALLSLGLKKGGSVAILMGNVPEWPIADIGTIAAGGVGVGLYPTSSAEQCQYIIDHSDAEFLIVDTRAQLEKVMSIRAALPKLRTIVVLDEEAASEPDQVIGYRELVRRGSENRERFSDLLSERAETAEAEDIAIMVYTSGTTGPPKGACLSHRYIIRSVESMRETVPIFDTDVAFSYLPYCHVAERISGLYNRLYAGASAYFVDDLSRLGEYMLEVKPTVFASLPRFFEKIHARIVADVEAAPEAERERFNQALEVGRRISRLRQSGQEVPQELQTEFDSYAAPVLKKVRDYFGGHIRLATSGGAPLPLEVAEFFDAAGLPILQAYGLTENICVAFNHPNNHKFGTVGPPMSGCEIKIAADGEIMVRSEMMFSGYYKAPQQTAEMFRDGWLLTGDIGELDDDGFLKITGRKKELIVTSTGKKISPALIENMLKEHHLISHALVYGEGRSYLVALITLNPAEAAEFARTHKITGDANNLARSEAMRKVVEKMIAAVNARVSTSESIKKFAIVEHDFEIEKDEVTPTGKLKREVVTAHHRDLIDNLYL
ncbi:MAG TPA: long-chain fatty acid--CoA ligase [Pyrinomonadaceae bacterium]|nr:long-chain fatty acid--CoA ligase [Pyrinomonadaceae bacterium]